MEALIRELQALKEKPDLSNASLLGAILATAVRVKESTVTLSTGLEALASALAMQSQLDAQKLHDDYLSIVKQQFASQKHLPTELRDIAAAIKLAAAHRK